MNREDARQVCPPDISVIVPVYNMKNYLRQCLDSLTVQTMENIEIIVVDDGSADRSLQICDEYAEKDPRMIVIHRENGGLSAARNSGLDAAQGEYVLFVDSDDWVEPDFCKAPFDAARQTGADLVVFQRMWHREGEEAELQPPFPETEIADKGKILTQWWDIVGVVSWNKLYRRSLFDNLRFPEGKLSEDTAVTHRAIYMAKDVCLLNRCLYHHRVSRPGSIMQVRSDRLIADEIGFNVLRMDDLRHWGYECGADEKRFACMYQIIMGRKAELSAHCDGILRGTGVSKDTVRTGSRKLNAMIGIYRFSPPLFDLISAMTGKRLRIREACHG